MTAVEVLSPSAEGSVVVLGDSLTDGITSTVGANHRWTDYLAARLREDDRVPDSGVLNQGISGNRLLRDGDPDRGYNGASGLNRLSSDVLYEAGARTLVVQLGINDILVQPQQTDADVIVAGLRELAGEARAAGLHVVGVTLAPFGGHDAYTTELERVRQQVNAQIRAGDVFDEVVDFDAAWCAILGCRTNCWAAYDSGDGLHPNDAGFQAMAEAVDLGSLVSGGDRRLLTGQPGPPAG